MSLLAFPAVLRAAETFSDSTAPQQQQQKTRTLSGTVLDAVTNEPVIGAAVQVRGRQGGEITDLDGMFTINVPSGAVITVTSLGYRSQSLNVGNRDNIRILLEPDSEVLEDVVVTAFGVGQKKESVVGAVQLVRPESLIVPSANLSTAFAGRLAGVVSFQRSGMPGQNGSDFYIRGISPSAELLLLLSSLTEWRSRQETSTPSIRRSSRAFPSSRTRRPRRCTEQEARTE